MPSREMDDTWSWRTVHQFQLAADEELVDADRVDARRRAGVPTRPMRRPFRSKTLMPINSVRKSRLLGHGTAPPGVGRDKEGRLDRDAAACIALRPPPERVPL